MWSNLDYDRVRAPSLLGRLSPSGCVHHHGHDFTAPIGCSRRNTPGTSHVHIRQFKATRNGRMAQQALAEGLTITRRESNSDLCRNKVSVINEVLWVCQGRNDCTALKDDMGQCDLIHP